MTSVNQRLHSLSGRAHTAMSVYPPVFGFFFCFILFFGTVQTFLTPPLPHCCRLIPQCGEVWVKGWTQVLSVLADTKCQYCNTKNLHYLFISSPGVLKARNCTVAVWRQILQSAPQSHFQFQGVDRKQNMYQEVGRECHR